MKTVDIVYIVGRGSVWQNNELRFSLRSIAKYGKNIGRVIIAGECPKFIDKSTIVHVPCKDAGKVKHANIMMKINAVIDALKMKQPFLISSDDHFLTCVTDFSNYPIISKGKLTVEEGSGEYFRSLNQTRDWLMQRGLPIFKTNPHYNTWIDPKVFKRLLPDILEANETCAPDGIEINCAMGNTLIHGGASYVTLKDCKVQEPHALDWWRQRLCERPALSIGDSALTRSFAAFLIETFPEQSPYEAEGTSLRKMFNPHA